MILKNLIKKIVELSYRKKEGHLGSSLSVLDIIYVLYKNILLKERSSNRLILSKGHASLGLYVVLDNFNLLEEKIDNFCNFNSRLGGHPCDKLNAVEASTGSLGHGLPIAVGMAMGYKINLIDGRIYVIIGDGEMNEGSIWEALLLASNHNLNNLTCILDYNRSNDRALKLDNVHSKIQAFNWHCIEINGHNHQEILNSLLLQHNHKPTFIIANTIKGKGISFMENNPEWHHKSPNEQEYNTILKELEI